MNRRQFLKKSLEGIVIWSISLVYNCNKNPINSLTSIIGEYKGTYSRISNYRSNNPFIEKGPINFKFVEKTYSCGGEMRYLPPSGSGEYKIVNDKIILKDTGRHTAEFDWTLILNGEFNFIFNNNNSLRLYQYDGKYDRYHDIFLTK